MSLVQYNLFIILDTAAADTKVAIFDNSFMLTVILIVFSTLLIAFIKHLKKDKCLKSFKSDIVTVYFNNGLIIKGRFDVENTGSELIIEKPDDTKRSYILYKEEYVNVMFFARFHADLDEKNTKKRLKELNKTYHPNFFRRIGRSINIFFKIINDSLMEIFTALSGRIKTADASYSKSESYATKVNKEAVSAMDTTYNPLLEKYIGNMVICSFLHKTKVYDIKGILKEYTGINIELLDAVLEVDGLSLKNVDLILPRKTTTVRHLGEEAIKLFNLQTTFNLDKYKRNIKKSSHDTVD